MINLTNNKPRWPTLVPSTETGRQPRYVHGAQERARASFGGHPPATNSALRQLPADNVPALRAVRMPGSGYATTQLLHSGWAQGKLIWWSARPDLRWQARLLWVPQRRPWPVDRWYQGSRQLQGQLRLRVGWLEVGWQWFDNDISIRVRCQL